ncbi:MAG: hypothetical protein N2662_10750, partial [Bacteroidales bacterium]|nr:hypothetical protein [Bacteroidales bacterium]
SIGKNTVNEYLKQFSQQLAPEKNIEAAIHSLHYLQFSVPVHLDKWNPKNPIPVCVLPAGWDEETLQSLETYWPDGTVSSISATEAPSHPVLVISEAERIDRNGNLITDQRGIVLNPESRIHFSQAIALAEKRHTLKAAQKIEPLIKILPDDSIAKLASYSKKQQEELQQLFKRKKSSYFINSNPNFVLKGFPNQPLSVALTWNKPINNNNLKYKIYASGYFKEPILGIRKLYEKKLIATTQSTSAVCTFPYASMYDIWVEAENNNQIIATSNFVRKITSGRRDGTTEYISKIYIPASKIRELEGWYVDEIELGYGFTIGRDNIKYPEGIKTIYTELNIWGNQNTTKIYNSNEFPLFYWNRYNYYDEYNGIYRIFWYEDDQNDDEKTYELAKLMLKLTLVYFGVDPAYVDLAEVVGKSIFRYDFNDEYIGEYDVVWWSPQQASFNVKGIEFFHSFDN